MTLGATSGPLLTWDADKDPWSQTGYKKQHIDKLQDELNQVNIGIGNTTKDYRAYRKRKLFSIVLDPDNPPERIKYGVQLPNWMTIERFFELNPRLCKKDMSRKRDVVLPSRQRMRKSSAR